MPANYASTVHPLLLNNNTEQNSNTNAIRCVNNNNKDGGAWSRPRCDLVSPRAAHSSCLMCETLLVVFGGWNGQDATNDLDVLDLETWEWSKVAVANAPGKRNNHAVESFGDTCYIHGGHDGSFWLDDFYVLSVRRLSNSSLVTSSSLQRNNDWSGNKKFVWQQITEPGPSGRACHTLTRIKWDLFCFGGYDGVHCFNDMFVYSIKNNAWSQIESQGQIPKGRNAHTMVAVNQNLLLCGGLPGRHPLTELHVFDTLTFTWSTIETTGSLPLGLRGHTWTAMGDQILLFGGFDGVERLNSCYSFDLPTSKWRLFESTNKKIIPRQRHTATRIDNTRILMFGGFDGQSWLDDMWILETSVLATEQLGTVILDNMRNLVNNPSFSDIQIKLNEEEEIIYAHRNILSVQCPYFNAMFSSHLRESQEPLVHFSGWSSEAFLAALNFAYTGSLRNCDFQLLNEIFSLSDHLGMDGLRQVCELRIIKQLDLTNVCHMLIRAEEINASELKAKCLEFIFFHSDELLGSSAFEELATAPKLLLEIAKMSLAPPQVTNTP